MINTFILYLIFLIINFVVDCILYFDDDDFIGLLSNDKIAKVKQLIKKTTNMQSNNVVTPDNITDVKNPNEKQNFVVLNVINIDKNK